MNKKDTYWLAGLLEGEGSFMSGPPSSPNLPVISMATTDEDIIQKVSELWNVKYHPGRDNRRKNNEWKDVFVIRIRGARAVEFMKTLNPLMGNRRQSQIKRAINSYQPAYRNLTEDLVLKIKAELSKGKKTQSEIAEQFGFRRETICRINKNKAG